VDTTRQQASHTLGKNIPALTFSWKAKITTGLPKQVGEVKSVSRGRRGKKRVVEREEKWRTLRRRKKKSLLLVPLKYDLVCTLVETPLWNTLPAW
jgi:hypothetical protein